MNKKKVVIEWSYPICYDRAYEKEIMHEKGLYYIYQGFLEKQKL